MNKDETSLTYNHFVNRDEVQLLVVPVVQFHLCKGRKALYTEEELKQFLIKPVDVLQPHTDVATVHSRKSREIEKDIDKDSVGQGYKTI